MKTTAYWSVATLACAGLACQNEPTDAARAPATPPPAKAARVTVNGYPISAEEIALYRSAKKPARTEAEAIEALVDLELMAQGALQKGLAEDLGVYDPAKLPAKARLELREDLARRLRLSVMDGLPKPSPEAVKAYFEEHRARMGVVFEVRTIRARTEEQARQAAQALAGGAPFAQVAAATATARPAPTKMGFDTMPEAWWDPVSKLEPGQRAGPLEAAGGGFAVVELISREQVEVPSVDAVAHRIDAVLRAQNYTAALEAERARLKKGAKIERQ